MLKKLSTLGTILRRKESGILLSYQIVITYMPALTVLSEMATVEIETLNLDEGTKSYKYGTITDKFNLISYLNECIADLAERSE